MPEPCSDEDLRKADQKTKDSYKQKFDRRHGAVPLTPLKPGDPVLVKTDEDSAWKKEGTVVAVDPENRTYLSILQLGVCVGAGSISRSFHDLAWSSLILAMAAGPHLIHRMPMI